MLGRLTRASRHPPNHRIAKLPRSASSLRNNLVRPHHFIILVLENVAVPDVASGKSFKARDDAGDHIGMRLRGILPSGFVWSGRLGIAGVFYLAAFVVIIGVKIPAVQNLKSHAVQMDGMRV